MDRIAIDLILEARGHGDAEVMMFVCGESGVKWDAHSMTRVQLS
jgi:hypothetical protein